MRINHNIAALNTYSRLTAATAGQAKSLAKLSSGQRINKAGDDAAGLAISEKMRAQIRGLNQASTNAQNGISMIQTAEGALNETHSILQRMRELSVQSANDTNTAQDRGEIQKEVNQLSSEINRIAGTTEFNKQVLLDGGAASGSVKGASAAVTKAGIDAQQGQYEYEFTACIDGATCDLYFCGANLYAQACTSLDVAASVSCSVEMLANLINTSTASHIAVVEGNKLTITAVKGSSADGLCTTGGLCIGDTAVCHTETVVSNGENACAQIQRITFTDEAIKEGTVVTVGNCSIGLWDSNAGTYANSAVAIAELGVDSVIDIACADGTVVCAEDFVDCANGIVNCTTFADVTLTQADDGILQISTTANGVIGANETKASVTAAAGSAAADGAGITLQIGANAGQSFTATFGDMTGMSLDVSSEAASNSVQASDGEIAYFTSEVTVDNNGTFNQYSLDVSTASKASAAISVLDDAINSVSAERSKLGAFQNRLEHTINNLNTSVENLTAAESRIRDVDMAKEMMEFTKNNILNQAATAMLAQANQQPQGVLQLLR